MTRTYSSESENPQLQALEDRLEELSEGLSQLDMRVAQGVLAYGVDIGFRQSRSGNRKYSLGEHPENSLQDKISKAITATDLYVSTAIDSANLLIATHGRVGKYQSPLELSQAITEACDRELGLLNKYVEKFESELDPDVLETIRIPEFREIISDIREAADEYVKSRGASATVTAPQR